MRKRIIQLSFLLLSGFILSCEKDGDKKGNEVPDTTIAPHAINLQGDDRLNSRVFLSWSGSDKDGYIDRFEFSLDNVTWSTTRRQDSTFKFPLDSGSDTTDIDFYIRAIDNEGAIDPSPAYLKIPLKNTAPVANFDDNSLPEDTTLLAYTFRWSASDLDGNSSIDKAFLKINEGAWVEINKSVNLITLLPQNPEATGAVTSEIYYNTNENAESFTLDGLKLNDDNTFYLKVTDIAGAESKIDTSDVVFVKRKTGDLILLGGISSTDTKLYSQVLSNIYGGFDYVNLFDDNGKFQPKFWDPTFYHITKSYDKMVFYSDNSYFTNPITGQSAVILEFAAPIIQRFSNNGGKTLISTTFTKGQAIDAISSTLPIDSLSSSNGIAYLHNDSAIVSTNSALYPDLSPTLLLFGITPFYHSADAEVLYNAQYRSDNGWVGPSTIGARRSNGTNYYQYFFSIELHDLDKEPNDLQNLLSQILNNDFNW